MSRARLEFALRNLKPDDWGTFEKFAADFLTVDYPSLRTMAAYAGDKGRDGQLYVPEEAPADLIQYSVAQDWESKIRKTLTRIEENFPNVRRLIYATNREIGPKADDLKNEIFQEKLVLLDVRDISWFVERRETHTQRTSASEDICVRIVDPLLKENNIAKEVGLVLNEQQARVGLLHLSLQNRDEATGRGLTKESFESLVLSALHDSSPSTPIPRKDIHDRVVSLLPAGHDQQIDARINATLSRLSRKGGKVKHFSKIDHFCLSYEEREKLADSIAAFIDGEQELEGQLIESASSFEISVRESNIAMLGSQLRSNLEWILFKQGESFASAASTGEMEHIGIDSLEEILEDQPLEGKHLVPPQIAVQIIVHVLNFPSPKVKGYLRRLADGYTMFAFLRQTPDVQKVVVSLFSEGTFWLDTSVILPLIAETLIEDESQRHYTTIFTAAVDAGIKLHVTDGIIEEVESHLHRCVRCSRNLSNWVGDVPFILGAYTMSGKARGSFPNWIENFRGEARPEEDVRQYLESVHRITRRNLMEESESAPIELRGAIKEIWFRAHERRRNQYEGYHGGFATQRLVDHDVETTTGIMMLRGNSESTAMGYRHWLVTLDKVAFRLKHEIPREVHRAPSSPVLSPDFLSQYLRVGPLRTYVEREQRANLPVLLDISKYDFIPKSLVETADQLRNEFSGLNERIIQRRIRDSLDRMRMTDDAEAKGGVNTAVTRVIDAIKRNPTRPD